MFSKRIYLMFFVTVLSACNREPYPLERGFSGDLPDQDVNLEADHADPGQEMFEDTDTREYKAEYCTKEELEEHRKSVTHGTHVDDEALICPKPEAPGKRAKSSTPVTAESRAR